MTRAEIVDELRSCGVVTLVERGVEKAFIDGSVDFPIADLHMDSLSAMELCIVLEQRWGLSVAPDELGRLDTLGNLVRILGGDGAR